MTGEEICRDYRLAKNRTKQIGTLAELTGKSKQEIVGILLDGGCEVPGNFIKKPKEQPEAPKAMPETVNPGNLDETASLVTELRKAYSDIEMLKETIVRLSMERVGVR